jgi:hypothetical protein
MRRPITRFAAAVTLAAMCSFAAPTMQRAQTAPSSGTQQFVVLQSEALTTSLESLTEVQAHCSISGNGNFASMRCQAPASTAKASYHYVAILVADPQGMAYGVACHQSLVDLWCKRMPVGAAIQGSFDGAGKSLLIADGPKSHSYQTLTSALVGPVQPGQPIASTKRGKATPAPVAHTAAQTSQPAAAAADTATDAASATASNGSPANPEPRATGVPAASSNVRGACVPAAASCTAFVSEPSGADIYVDGKFVGSTPSTLALAPGSHEIRIQAEKFKPWTRTLESTAGSAVTVHAALSKK